jgi:hypothetical protein
VPNLQWYSICSAHNFDADCELCKVGHWIDESDPEVIADRALWVSNPNAWRAKHAHDALNLTTREVS